MKALVSQTWKVCRLQTDTSSRSPSGRTPQCWVSWSAPLVHRHCRATQETAGSVEELGHSLTLLPKTQQWAAAVDHPCQIKGTSKKKAQKSACPGSERLRGVSSQITTGKRLRGGPMAKHLLTASIILKKSLGQRMSPKEL